MSRLVNPDFFCEQFTVTLSDWSDDVAKNCKKAVETTSKEVMKEIRAHVTFNNRTGDYVRSFALKTNFEDKRNMRRTWYVKEPHYRLTHLLEKGHRVWYSGNQTGKFEHIIYGEEIAQRLLPELMERAVHEA
jgi:hypothetical protein